jgi:hypothetical protein
VIRLADRLGESVSATLLSVIVRRLNDDER